MSGTLWGGDEPLDARLDRYTVGDDRRWDRRLLAWDAIGSIAHVEGLKRIGLLPDEEAEAIVAALQAAVVAVLDGKLTVGAGDEDAHSALEKHLVEVVGELGLKVHAGRSRNDQVQVDLRLWLKRRLIGLAAATSELARRFAAFAEEHERVVWPGYTHQRRAMPSTAGLWAGGYAELLADDLLLLEPVLAWVDRSPLGSAAGYGVPLRLDREGVAASLGFAGPQNNVTAVQNSRGKVEVAVIQALWHVAHDLGKFATDAILFSADEFGFLVLPADLCTGSSIMPQKKNPDLFELTRARSALVDGYVAQATALSTKLPGGYHRDHQLGKGVLMRAVDTVEEMVDMMSEVVPRLAIDANAARAAVSPEMLATDEVFLRVREGTPFRTAYREIVAELAEGKTPPHLDAAALIDARDHVGGAGRLNLDEVRQCLDRADSAWQKRRVRFEKAMASLLGTETAARL